MPMTPTARWFSAALVATTATFGTVQAAVLDFDELPPSIYFSGETIVQGDFTFTVAGDFGIVDTAAACSGGVCPTGNTTQFYQGLNDGHLQLARTDGVAFSLLGFDAGFLVADSLLAVGVPGQIVISPVDSGGATLTGAWDFAGADGSGGFPFASYAGAALAQFGSITSVDIYACTFNATGDCLNPGENPGLFGPAQFGLDNVNVAAAVPEPASVALMGLGLAALVGVGRRRAAAQQQRHIA